MNSEIIEILPITLLDREREQVYALKRLAKQLGIEFGWHYLLDLTWILSKLGPVQGMRIMDAGAGAGVLQWYLAEGGAEVFSVDRESRAGLPRRFRRRFRIQGLRDQDLGPVVNKSAGGSAARLRITLKEIIDDAKDKVVAGPNSITENRKGSVILYNQDLKGLVDIPDDSQDAIVAVSALEHNSPQDLEQVVTELIRILKPGRPLLATLGAAKEQDWFHQPSKGWCYTEDTLRRAFGLSQEVPSNYDQYDRLFTALRNCRELRENLARFYFKSGENGMPWGIWDPQYQPVGVCKVKLDE